MMMRCVGSRPGADWRSPAKRFQCRPKKRWPSAPKVSYDTKALSQRLGCGRM